MHGLTPTDIRDICVGLYGLFFQNDKVEVGSGKVGQIEEDLAVGMNQKTLYDVLQELIKMLSSLKVKGGNV